MLNTYGKNMLPLLEQQYQYWYNKVKTVHIQCINKILIKDDPLRATKPKLIRENCRPGSNPAL